MNFPGKITAEADARWRGWVWSTLNQRFRRGRHRLSGEHERWRKIAELQHLSRAARGRLEWIIFRERHRKDVALTARHFGIARKTFYQWLPRFEKEFLRGLEERSRTPHRRRTRQYTPMQYERIVHLRQENIRYGKMKLLALYRQRYATDTQISAWKVQCIIEASGLYYSPPAAGADQPKACGVPHPQEDH
jgi:hypothetical protein